MTTQEILENFSLEMEINDIVEEHVLLSTFYVYPKPANKDHVRSLSNRVRGVLTDDSVGYWNFRNRLMIDGIEYRVTPQLVFHHTNNGDLLGHMYSVAFTLRTILTERYKKK